MLGKSIIVLSAALVLGASAASAQIFRGDIMQQRMNTAQGAFAQAGGSGMRLHSTNPSHDVYDTRGSYVGSDPDPLVRLDLLRNPPGRED
jgi:hypothetical protein